MSKLREILILHILFPIADMLMGTCAMKWYRRICRMSRWSRSELKAWQEARLRLLVEHAYHHTRYYREVFDNLGLKPYDIRTFKDLGKLPVLTRDIIKSRYDDLVPDNIRRFRHRIGKTGGSTGEPMKFIYDENTWGFVTAMKIFWWKTTGYRYGNLFISLGSASLFPVNKRSFVHDIYFKLRNTIPLNGMNMDDDICQRYMDIVIKKKVRYIYGYATAVFLLARYCLEQGVKWKMNCAFSTAEKLTDFYRETIEKAWDTKVLDCYGSRDGGITAYETELHKYAVGYASYLEAGSPGKPSRLLSTNLIDFSFPMIRYVNGDEVEMNDSDVDSGYNGQMMKTIVGRTSEVVRLANGHRLTTSGFNTMFRGFNVEAFRIRKTGEMEVTVNIQKRPSFTESEHDLILDTMHKYVGADCEVKIVYVNEMEPLKNGKRSFLLNE